MKKIISMFTLMGAVSTSNIASATPALGFRDIDATPPTDYDCTVETIDDLTCELACDGPTTDFECACEVDLCECIDSTSHEFSMSPDPDEGAWCDQLRRGGGHYNKCCDGPDGPGCTKYCPDKAPPPSGECAPCLYGCTNGTCN